jgi:hypothetical protein
MIKLASAARNVLGEKKLQDAQGRLERREERRKPVSPPMFSKRHYEAIADLIAKLYAVGTSAVKMDVLIGHFSQRLVEDNERFDEIRFRQACKST